MRAELGEDAWGESPEAALRHDLYALRREFGCEIRHRPGTGYQLVTLGELHLLDLPDDHLQALHTLIALADTLPVHLADGVAGLLGHVMRLLPPERRITVPESTDERFASPKVVTAPDRTTLRHMRRAIRRQQLTFRYRSTFATTADGIEHRVAPYGLLVREGQLYLDADCLWADSPEWRARPIFYRLDRIIPGTLRVLPDVVPPGRVATPSYELRYELMPAVARQRDLALHFDGCHVEYRVDGSALITATIDDLWWARLVLLRYGANCRVLSPPELVAMMRETIRDMATVYGI